MNSISTTLRAAASKSGVVILSGYTVSPFLLFQSVQARVTLEEPLAPPLDKGTMWSIVFAGSPQY